MIISHFRKVDWSSLKILSLYSHHASFFDNEYHEDYGHFFVLFFFLRKQNEKLHWFEVSKDVT